METLQDSTALAATHNGRLASRIRRWLWTRALLVMASLAVGALVWYGTGGIGLALPFLLLAALFSLLWLDAHGSLREVKRRKWKRITPLPSRKPPPLDTAASVEAPNH